MELVFTVSLSRTFATPGTLTSHPPSSLGRPTRSPPTARLAFPEKHPHHLARGPPRHIPIPHHHLQPPAHLPPRAAQVLRPQGRHMAFISLHATTPLPASSHPPALDSGPLAPQTLQALQDTRGGAALLDDRREMAPRARGVRCAAGRAGGRGWAVRGQDPAHHVLRAAPAAAVPRPGNHRRRKHGVSPAAAGISQVALDGLLRQGELVIIFCSDAPSIQRGGFCRCTRARARPRARSKTTVVGTGRRSTAWRACSRTRSSSATRLSGRRRIGTFGLVGLIRRGRILRSCLSSSRTGGAK